MIGIQRIGNFYKYQGGIVGLAKMRLPDYAALITCGNSSHLEWCS
jgi:hypothetical protein